MIVIGKPALPESPVVSLSRQHSVSSPSSTYPSSSSSSSLASVSPLSGARKKPERGILLLPPPPLLRLRANDNTTNNNNNNNYNNHNNHNNTGRIIIMGKQYYTGISWLRLLGLAMLYVLPMLITFLLVALQMLVTSDVGFALAVIPRTKSGMVGIPLNCWPHWSWTHWATNIVGWSGLALLMLTFGVWPFLLVSGMIQLSTGFAVWCVGQSGAHAGLSGLLCGYFGFIVVSVVFERPIKPRTVIVVAITLVTYAAMFFTTLTNFKHTVSWEGHLFGLLSGIAYSGMYFRSWNSWMKNPIHAIKSFTIKPSPADSPSAHPQPFWTPMGHPSPTTTTASPHSLKMKAMDPPSGRQSDCSHLPTSSVSLNSADTTLYCGEDSFYELPPPIPPHNSQQQSHDGNNRSDPSSHFVVLSKDETKIPSAPLGFVRYADKERPDGTR